MLTFRLFMREANTKCTYIKRDVNAIFSKK